jgi:hypothetical protein
MIERSAIQAVTEYVFTMNAKPVRFFLTQGCGGHQLAMALDDVNAPENSANKKAPGR